LVGEYIRNYREGRGIRARTKVIIIALLWATILYSAIFIVKHLVIQALLIVIALAVSAHILTLKTLET
jgi:uncharacterized membrane protein YbaN (DUF454 family)